MITLDKLTLEECYLLGIKVFDHCGDLWRERTEQELDMLLFTRDILPFKMVDGRFSIRIKDTEVRAEDYEKVASEK